MKRKVFSLLVLCLFAFLGLANAQTTGVVNANPDPIDLGYRPLGAWMRPLEVQLTATGASQAITALEADKDFFVIDAQIPGTVSGNVPYKFTVTHGEGNPGAINGNVVVTTNSRKAYIFDIQAVAYSPIAADVAETAPTITLPFTATVGENIYDNYLLPGTAPDGKDVIYKMNVTEDILFNANVEGANGKVALYTEDFNGEPGPGADNNYTGAAVGEATGGPFEAEVGVSTTTSGYVPAYYLYNYAMSQQLYLADELIAAGANAGNITSLGFYSNSTYGYQLKNTSIYLGNTTATVTGNTSPNIANMTLVYSGDFQEVVGLNEFVFDTPFAWDGTSNILVFFIMNNGTWSSSILWQVHNPGFQASAYAYQDSAPYNPAVTTTMTTSSTVRATALFKGVGRDQMRGIDNMTLTPGTYYIAASSTSDEFTVNIENVELPLPEKAYNPYPADGDVEITTPTTLTWTFGNYTTAYRVLLGTTYPPTEVVVDWTNELTNGYYTGELYHNKNYFWRVDERNSTGETIGDIWGFTTTLNHPEELSALEEKIYEGDALNLVWDQINDRSYRGYNVYKDGVKINDEVITTTEYTVTGLTYNMEGYQFNVTAVYDEGESGFSNDLTVFVSGNGTVSGKVTDVDGTTGVYGVQVFFEGVDEFLRPVSYNFTTAANGTYSGQMKAGSYTAYTYKETYQPAEYNGQILINYNTTTPNINFTIREVFNTVGEVLAEEVSDNEVKVYWSQNIMSEIIEDFETGDLSSFDWVNDATYPWTVVTTNPQEGSYCIKSGNAGVNSSSSAIQVAVEISRDGLMSFYHRISCENSYDKGHFYIDGVEKTTLTGDKAWQQKEYPITAGVHTFKWEYTKDSSVSSGEDAYYVDNISFIHDAEPVEPAEAGWIYYDNGECETGIGTSGGNFSWGIMFPAGSYSGNAITKVSAYDYMSMTGNVTIYNDGVTAPATAVGQTNVTFTGSSSFVEFTFASPVTIDPSKNLWVIFYNGSGATYPAACCADSGDPNGRWVSIDGTDWMDLASAGLEYTFMVRAFTSNAKGEIEEIVVNNPHTGGTLSTSGIAMGNRSFHHFNVYRTTADDVTGQNAQFLTSTNDTVYFDENWASLEPGIYRWGVSRVYQGNRGGREVLESQDFESGDLGNWTSIDADGDGYEWYVLLNSTTSSDLPGHNNSDGHATSASYQSVALNPDNYLVSPEVTLGGSITFWACAQDASWPEEHFGVAVSTTNNTSASAFTTIQAWDMTAKSSGAPTDVTRSGNRAQGAWYQYTVDLSAYAGQTGYVAIRHFNCTDWFRLNVDDIEITGAGGGPTPPTPPTPTDPNGTPGFVDGESNIIWSNPIEHKMFVSTTINVLTNSGDDVTGATVELNNLTEEGYTYNVTLDETATYTWENMRRGTYQININLDGFTPISETVELLEDENNIRYFLEEIISQIDELYVSATGWAMFGDVPAPTPVDPDDPDEPTGGFEVDFEGGIPAGWTVLDANNDGWTWTATSAIPSTWTYYASLSLDWYHNGSDAVCSGSYINGVGALNPDEFLISPQVVPANGSTFSFWAAATDASYPADHFGVFVSTTGTNPSDFTSVQEWTLTAKNGGTNGGKASRDGNGAKLGTWYNFSVDLSAYAGNSIYIAIRHFSCYDQYIMCVDDIAFTTNRSVEYYNVKLNGEPEGTTTHKFFQHNVANLVEGETYTTSVQAVYATGTSEWVDFDWVYSACDNYEGLKEDPTAQWQGEDVVLNWVLPEGSDIPNPPTPPSGDDSFTVDFESGLPTGWTILDANNDGWTWTTTSNIPSTWTYYASLSLDWYHNGSNAICSGSYINGVGALNPDEYLISPQVAINNGSTFSFWAAATDASYPADHFGVFVSTSGTNPSDFTSVQEWTLTAKNGGTNGGKASRDGNGAKLGTWYNYSVNLSDYAGQNVYIAIRHFNCYDQYIMCVDDMALTSGSKGNRTFDYDFEGSLQGWTTIDADGNGLNWYHSSNSVSQSGYDYTGLGHNGTNGFAVSQSYIDYDGAYQADNYLVSPQMYALQAGSTITFYADNANDSYPDHFGVYVATAANPTASDFTAVWQGNAKTNNDKVAVRHDAKRYQNWRQHNVDLGAYAGQTVWIAFRHNDYDEYEIWIDDVTINAEGGTTPVDPDDPPTPGASVRGVEIFRDGEWIAEVASPAQTYTDINPGEVGEYEIRVVYNGNTADYTHYTMSCPEVCVPEEFTCLAPENLTGSYEYFNDEHFGAFINWTYSGEVSSETLSYDNGAEFDGNAAGLGGGAFKWASMFPAGSFSGNMITKISNPDPIAMTGTLSVYSGGSTEPQTLIASMDITFNGIDEYVDYVFDEPVMIDPTQNLWVVFDNVSGATYPAAITPDVTNDPNGRWLYVEGYGWLDMASAGLTGYSWMIHVDVCDAVLFKIYRNNQVIATVPYTGESMTFYDETAIGNYQYQVTALTEVCESDFALTPDLSQNYVEIMVTDVAEVSDTRIYPNPTTGNVTIEANGMNHITVVNTLGQVVYDTNINGDTFRMNLGQFQAGVYMLRISTESGVSVTRVTVTK